MSTTLLTKVQVTGLPEFVAVHPGPPEGAASLFENSSWVALADDERLSADALRGIDWAALESLEDGADAAILSAFSDDPLADTWERLPPELAILTTNPNTARVVAIRPSVLGDDVDNWLAALTNASSVAYVPCHRSEGFPAAALPELAPSSPTGSRGIVDAVRGASVDTNVRAGLLLMHDFLEESHTLAQKSGGRDGDYWHAIMHRREPDPSNAKYWFRRVGDHPVFDELRRVAEPILTSAAESVDGDWDPFAFVDLCERARAGGGHEQLRNAARRVQFAEMVLLLAHCAA